MVLISRVIFKWSFAVQCTMFVYSNVIWFVFYSTFSPCFNKTTVVKVDYELHLWYQSPCYTKLWLFMYINVLFNKTIKITKVLSSCSLTSPLPWFEPYFVSISIFGFWVLLYYLEDYPPTLANLFNVGKNMHKQCRSPQDHSDLK